MLLLFFIFFIFFPPPSSTLRRRGCRNWQRDIILCILFIRLLFVLRPILAKWNIILCDFFSISWLTFLLLGFEVRIYLSKNTACFIFFKRFQIRTLKGCLGGSFGFHLDHIACRYTSTFCFLLLFHN
jgi:hypothetical protein